jgi:hypothetical protein
LTTRWQISAGEIAGWLPPLLYAFAALASAWVLHDARRRFPPPYAVAAWTLATLIHTPVVLPLYLVARLFKPHPTDTDAAPDSTAVGEAAPAAAAAAEETNAATTHAGTDTAANPVETRVTGTDAAELNAAQLNVAGDATAREQIPDDAGEPTVAAAADTPLTIRAPFLRLRYYAPSLLYLSALLLAGAFHFYRDYHSFDAHLTRAADARLLNRRDGAIREYRAALRIVDDAHTHHLLAVQLAADGQAEAALAELRAAERGGEPDELLPLRVASALDALGRADEAAAAYEKFLLMELCSRRSPPAPQCATAAERARQLRGGVEVR